MIKGVTFDGWHSLAETPWPDSDERMRQPRVERIEEDLSRAGVDVSREALSRAYDAHTNLLVRPRSGRVDLAAETRLPVLIAGVEDSLRSVREAGYRVGLISNTGRTWGRFLRKVQAGLGIDSYFDVRVFSDEVRVRKPDPQIFEAALDGLGLDPSEVVHIGDDVDADVAGANDVGMGAVWFNIGFWPDARTERADAEIHDARDVLRILEAWRR